VKSEISEKRVVGTAGPSLLLRRYCRPIDPCTDIFLWRRCLRALLSKIVLPLLKRDSIYERIKKTTAQSEVGS